MFTIHFVITSVLYRMFYHVYIYIMAMGQNPVLLVNLKIGGKSMFIPQKLIVTGFDLPHM